MRRRMIPLVALVAIAAACANPRLTYVQAEKSYKEMVDFAAQQRAAGLIDNAQYRKLNVPIQAADKALERWNTILLETPVGEKPDIPQTIYEAVLDALDILEAYWVQQRKQ